MAHYTMGAYQAGADLLGRNVEYLTGEVAREHFGLAALPSRDSPVKPLIGWPRIYHRSQASEGQPSPPRPPRARNHSNAYAPAITAQMTMPPTKPQRSPRTVYFLWLPL